MSNICNRMALPTISPGEVQFRVACTVEQEHGLHQTHEGCCNVLMDWA